MGGRALADALVAQGIEHVFAVPGESYLEVLDALFDVRRAEARDLPPRGRRRLHGRAYGKLTGKPGAAMVTRGPGACHAAIGVHTAMQDRTPMLLFVARSRTRATARRFRRSITARCSPRSPNG